MSAGFILILAGVVAMNKAKDLPTSNIGFILIVVGAALFAEPFLS